MAPAKAINTTEGSLKNLNEDKATTQKTTKKAGKELIMIQDNNFNSMKQS